MDRLGRRKSGIVFVMIALTIITGWARTPIATFSAAGNGCIWTPSEYGKIIALRVSGPEDYHLQKLFDGIAPQIEALPADGIYHYELTVMPRLTKEQKALMRDARESGDMREAKALRDSSVLPKKPLKQSGAFSVVNGVVVTATQE